MYVHVLSYYYVLYNMYMYDVQCMYVIMYLCMNIHVYVCMCVCMKACKYKISMMLYEVEGRLNITNSAHIRQNLFSLLLTE